MQVECDMIYYGYISRREIKLEISISYLKVKIWSLMDNFRFNFDRSKHVTYYYYQSYDILKASRAVSLFKFVVLCKP